MTKHDAAGVERWPDGTPVSTNNAFRVGWGGASFDIAAIMRSATSSRAGAARVMREQAAGKRPGLLPGISTKADNRARYSKAPEMMKRAAAE